MTASLWNETHTKLSSRNPSIFHISTASGEITAIHTTRLQTTDHEYIESRYSCVWSYLRTRLATVAVCYTIYILLFGATVSRDHFKFATTPMSTHQGVMSVCVCTGKPAKGEGWYNHTLLTYIFFARENSSRHFHSRLHVGDIDQIP